MSYARRLLRAVNLPQGAPRLLQHERYWRTDIVEALCDRCDELVEFGDPSDEECLAEVAYDLTSRLRHVSSALKVRALYTLGTARRRHGHLGQASRCYQAAWRTIDQGDVALHAVVALAERHAVLLREQGRHRAALDMIRYAIMLNESLGLSTSRAKIIEGVVLSYQGDVGSAKHCFIAVLRKTSPRDDGRLYYAAIENLAYLLAAYGSLEELVEARALASEVRQEIRGIRRTPVRYRLDWIDAVLHRRLGELRRACRDLRRARRGFARLGMLAELATTTVELAATEIDAGGESRVVPLLRETVDHIRTVDLDSPLATAYLLALELPSPRSMVEALQAHFAPSTDARHSTVVPIIPDS